MRLVYQLCHIKEVNWFSSISALRKRQTKKQSLLFWVSEKLYICDPLSTFLCSHGLQSHSHSDLIHVQLDTLESHLSKEAFLRAALLGHSIVSVLWCVT